MSLFFWGSLIFSFLTLVFVIRLVTAHKYLLVKPSIWFLALYNIQLQWSTVFYHDVIEETLLEPFNLFVVIHVFPLFLIIFSRYVFTGASKTAWANVCQCSSPQFHRDQMRLLKLCGGLAFMVVGIYLFFVPLTQTGLYYNLFYDDPIQATIARENSLKLLPYTWLKYLYKFFTTTIATTIVALVSIMLYRNWRRNPLFSFLLTIGAVSTILAAALPGARSSMVTSILAFTMAWVLSKKGRVNVVAGLAIVPLILFPAVFLQLSKFDEAVTFETLFSGFEVVFDRILYVPLHAGLYWMHYTESNPYWGIGGIPKLAWIVGAEPLNVSNILMNHYFPSTTTDTGYLSASFVFTYYSYFGLAIVPFYTFMILALDTCTLVHKRIPPAYIIPAVCTVNLSVMALTATEYLTIFLTYGLFTGSVFFLAISYFLIKRRRNRFEPQSMTYIQIPNAPYRGSRTVS